MAGQLIPGDRVLGHDGKSAGVERIDEDFGFRRVYNLTVSEFHTFFVGGVEWGFSVWVHNQSWCEQIAKLRDAIKSGVPEAIAKERASTKAMIESAGKDPKLADDIRKSLAGRSDIEKIIGDDARKALGGFAPKTFPTIGMRGRVLSAAEQAEFNAFAQRAQAVGLEASPYRTGSWGRTVNGRFQEVTRIDVAEAGMPGFRGQTHMHIAGQDGHLPLTTPLPGE